MGFGFGGRFKGGNFAINSIKQKSSAATAGLQIGDVITKINGGDAQRTPFGELTGKTIKLTMKRGNKKGKFR